MWLGRRLKADKIKLTDMVTVGKMPGRRKPALRGSSVMFLKPGDQVSVADLIQRCDYPVGNDACIALADYCCRRQESFIGFDEWLCQKTGSDQHYLPDGARSGCARAVQYRARYGVLGKALISMCRKVRHS